MEGGTLTSPAPFIHPLPPPPNPIQKIIKNPRRYFAEVWFPTSQSFRPNSNFMFFLCKIEILELLRTSSRDSEKFGPEVRRTCLLRSQIWPKLSEEGLRGFAICFAGGFSLNFLLNHASLQCYNSRHTAAEPMFTTGGNTHHILKNKPRKLPAVKKKKLASRVNLYFSFLLKNFSELLRSFFTSQKLFLVKTYTFFNTNQLITQSIN